MKRFIVISLMATVMAKAFGCALGTIHNYYLFSVCNPNDWQWHVDKTCMDNWRSYTGDSDMRWFDKDAVMKKAQQKGDDLMVSYLQNLDKYLDCCNDIKYAWDYPTQEELNKRNKTLTAVRTYAQSKLNSRLRSQHALLFMRCNMLLGRHKENITFYEQTASKYIESIYRDMMRNIYAGALTNSNRKTEGNYIFAEQGDYQSLYTTYYKGRSAEAIWQEYQRDPQSPVLPFLLQDFVNNAQEAADLKNNNYGSAGKLFIRTISDMESKAMCQMAEKVIKEGKTNEPALWKTAQAWLTYLRGERQQALAISSEATAMDGSERIKDNARVIHLYVQADLMAANNQLDQLLANELPWLTEKAGPKQEDYHYVRVMDRLVHNVLVDKYMSAQRFNTATLLLTGSGVGGQLEDRSSDAFRQMDTLSISTLDNLFDYMSTPAAQTQLDRWLTQRTDITQNFINELMGTKYLRQGQWQKAADRLEKVPLDYINNMAIRPYLAKRSFSSEPWLKRQKMSWDDMESSTRIYKNKKLQFAQDMMTLEKGIDQMSDLNKYQSYYELAVHYYQASVWGEAWFITRYGKSTYGLERRSDEIDFLGKAAQLLTKAKESPMHSQKEKSLYALAYLPIEPWRESVWNNQTYRYEDRFNKQGFQHKALTELLAFKKKNATRISSYVSRCDVLKQFERRQ